jgi:hypothetical protein
MEADVTSDSCHCQFVIYKSDVVLAACPIVETCKIVLDRSSGNCLDNSHGNSS